MNELFLQFKSISLVICDLGCHSRRKFRGSVKIFFGPKDISIHKSKRKIFSFSDKSPTNNIFRTRLFPTKFSLTEFCHSRIISTNFRRNSNQYSGSPINLLSVTCQNWIKLSLSYRTLARCYFVGKFWVWSKLLRSTLFLILKNLNTSIYNEKKLPYQDY